MSLFNMFDDEEELEESNEQEDKIAKSERELFEQVKEEAKSDNGLCLDNNVSSSYAGEQDTARVKYGLSELGYYQAPEKYGFTRYPDDQMFDGVKSYQQDKELMVDGRLTPKGETITRINQDLKDQNSPAGQIFGAAKDMASEYFAMKSHNYVNLDDYHHCKANYEATKRGKYGEKTAEYLGNAKEKFDYYANQYYKGLSRSAAEEDKKHDLLVNEQGRANAKYSYFKDAKDACANYRKKNKSFPKKYW